MLGLNTPQLANEILDLAHGFGIVSLFILCVDSFRRFVQKGADNREVTVAELGKTRMGKAVSQKWDNQANYLHCTNLFVDAVS